MAFFPPSQPSTLVTIACDRASEQADGRLYTYLARGESVRDSLTYGELDRRARAIAAHLQATLPPGSPVLLLYPAGLEFIAAFFGCLYAGMPAVPAYPPRRNQTLARLLAIVSDAGAKAILTAETLVGDIQQRFETVLERDRVQWVATDVIEQDARAPWVPPNLTSESLAFLQYTSGSTGTPKGVAVTHGNLLANLATIRDRFHHNADSQGVIWLPPYHDMGLIGGILQPLYVGFPVTLMSPVDFLQKPWRWLQAISDCCATTSGGPNFAYDLCVQKVTAAHKQTLDLSHWQVAFNGAEPVRQATLDRFTAAFADCGFKREAFYPCYGMAEATLFVTGGAFASAPTTCDLDTAALAQHQVAVATEAYPSTTWVSCGRPMAADVVKIVDPDSQQVLESDRVGEIWVSGAGIARGYWNQPEATQEIFHARTADTCEGPFLRTGDLGFLRDGELYVTGRLKDAIVIRGRNHYPQDIEQTVDGSHPSVRAGCGAAFSVEMGGEERLAIAQEVERSALRDLDANAVVRAIRQVVSEQHDIQVSAVMLLKTASIPKTSSGKIQRYACRSGFVEGSLNVVGMWTAADEIDPVASPQETLEMTPLSAPRPQSPESAEDLEIWLIERLAAALNVDADEIDPQEPFAYYGLDSAVAVSLTGELGEWLGRELEPTLFWEYPDIASLTEFLASDRPASANV